MWFFFCGETNIFLSLLNKVLSLIVVLVGGVFGWVLGSFGHLWWEKSPIIGTKGGFGLVYM